MYEVWLRDILDSIDECRTEEMMSVEREFGDLINVACNDCNNSIN